MPVERRAKLRKLATRIVPYAIGALVVVAILRRYRLNEIIAALSAGTPWRMLPVAFGFSVAQILVVSIWDTLILTRLLGELRYYDVLRVKAGCAVLQAIGYFFNQGAYAVWIARATGRGARVAAGLVLFTIASDLTAGCIVASTSIYFGLAKVSPVLQILAPSLGLSVIAMLFGIPRRPFDPEKPKVLRVFGAVPRGLAAAQILARCINVSMIIVATWLGFRAFGLPVPLRAAIAYVPVVMLVGSLPVNVAGIGAVQGAWLLFTPWISGPQVLAFALVWNLMLMASQVVRGLPFVRRVMAEVEEGRLANANADDDSAMPIA